MTKIETVAPPSRPAARRPSAASRRTGYSIAAVVNSVLLYLVNVSPGWEAVPFLTADTRQVLALVNLSLVYGLVTSLGYLAYDPPWFKAAGDVGGSLIALAVLLRLWEVFPFDFTGSTYDWGLVARTVLVFAIAGTAIAIVVQTVTLVLRLVRGPVGRC